MRSFTIIELIVVVVIISVLATISYSNYLAYRDRSLDSEAGANLALIVAAERVFRMEQNFFYISAAENLLNQNLRLFLPTAANRPWQYQTVLNGVNCCARARRSTSVRTWQMCTNDNAPVLIIP